MEAGAVCALFGAIVALAMSVDRLRRSLEGDLSKTQALLSEIRNKLGK
jgi:hypothetical protein